MLRPAANLILNAGLKTTFVRNLSSKAMKETDAVLLHLQEEVAVISFNRPNVRNAINFQVLKCLRDIIDKISFSKEVKVAVLKSEHDGVYCAGADLSERATLPEPEYRRWSHTVRALTSDLAHLRMPLFAALDGHALGGGLELALACDGRIAASNVVVGLPETGLAIIPGAGGTQRLPRLIGPALAKELIFTGRRLNAQEAGAMGIFNEVVQQNEAGDAAFMRTLDMVEEIKANGPIAVTMAKVAINHGMEVDLHTGLAIEAQCYAQVIPTKDRIEGLKAFKEKRPAKFTGE